MRKLIMNFLHNDFHKNNLQIFSEVSLIIPNSKYFYQGNIASTCFALGDALRKSNIRIAHRCAPRFVLSSLVPTSLHILYINTWIYPRMDMGGYVILKAKEV